MNTSSIHHESDRGHAVVIMSIGDATAHHINALTRVLRRPADQIARSVLRAPSLLIDRIDADQAAGVCRELERAGIVADSVARDAVPPEDPRSFDLALRVTSVQAIDDVLGDLVRLLAVSPRDAREILLRDPAVFLGGVTLATAEALRGRFERAGVHVDVSETGTARYDILSDAETPSDRARVRDALREAGVPSSDGKAGPIVAAELDLASARRAAEALKRSGGSARLLNRDFNWFDVRLVSASDGPELRAALHEMLGIPQGVVGRLLSRLPVVLAPQVRASEAEAIVAGLAGLGAVAEATLLSTRRFGLRVTSVGSGRETETALAALGWMTASERQGVLAGKTAVLPGPFSLLHARWLQRELAAAGTKTELFTR